MSQFPPSNSPFGNSPNPYAPSQAVPTPIPAGSVKNWLVESIIALICCAGVFAIPAIIYAAQVNTKLAAGDYQGAVDSASKAKTWLMVAVVVGFVCGGLMLVFQIMVAVAANH